MRSGSRTMQVLVLLLIVLLAGCSTTGKRRSGGGYYSDDGPDAHPPSNLDSIPDAVPRIEPYATTAANKPYVVFGKRYEPDLSGRPYRESGIASWYGRKFRGHSTSDGEPYDMYAMTAAHPTLPIPSYARVTSAINGRSIIVRVNDRGPFHSDRIMDLSYVAAYKLGIIGPGSGEVTVQELTPSDIRTMLARGTSEPAPSSATAFRSSSAADDATTSMITAAPQARMSAGSAMSEPPEPGLDRDIAAGVPISEQPLSAPPRPLPPPPRDAVAEIAAAPRTQAPFMAGGGVYLQFGAFGEQANAQSLAMRLERQLSGSGLPPATIEQAGRLFKVSVGPYANRQAAQQALETANGRTGLTASIVAR